MYISFYLRITLMPIQKMFGCSNEIGKLWVMYASYEINSISNLCNW